MEQEKEASEAEKELRSRLYTVEVVETRLAAPPKDLGEVCCCRHAIDKVKPFLRDATPAYILIAINHAGKFYRIERFKTIAGPVHSLIRSAICMGEPTIMIVHYLPTLGEKITRDEIECDRESANRLFKATYYAGMTMIDYAIVGPAFNEESGKGYYAFSRSKKFNKMRNQVATEMQGPGPDMVGPGQKVLGRLTAKVQGPDGRLREISPENARQLLDNLIGGMKKEKEDDEEEDDPAGGKVN